VTKADDDWVPERPSRIPGIAVLILIVLLVIILWPHG
jgi:hypothetical protein